MSAGNGSTAGLVVFTDLNPLWMLAGASLVRLAGVHRGRAI